MPGPLRKAFGLIAPQRYCYAYGTLTGTATLTRRRDRRFGCGRSVLV
ncbi:MAG TPA: hypothetical protein IGR15_05030 [Synechococcus sp. M44_DOE_062]|nr:hypothetical protein [Synechococcus sp. M44_DOE_062]